MLKHLHGSQRSTASLVLLRVNGRQQAACTPKPLVPTLLVEVDVLGVDLVVKVWVSYVQFIRRHSYNRAIEIVELGDLLRVLPLVDNFVVALVPACGCRNPGARKAG